MLMQDVGINCQILQNQLHGPSGKACKNVLSGN